MLDKLSSCPYCLNDTVSIKETFVFGIQIKCELQCLGCGYTLTARTTKKAIKKWKKEMERWD